jgi:hypothetical protein
VIIVIVVGIIGLAIVSRANSEVDSVSAKRRHDQGVSCADAARDLLMSQFTSANVIPTELTLNTTVGDKTMTTGHFDAVTVTKTVTVAGTTSQSNVGMTDMSNRIGVSLGGKVYRMTLLCSSGTLPDGGAARQNEVEYLVRFGL